MDISKQALNEELDTVIHLRSLYGPYHAGMSISPVRNPITKDFPSCVRAVDSDGNIILGKDDDPLEYFVRTNERFTIKDGDEFDLSNPVKSKQWEAIKFSDLIYDSKGKRDEKGNIIVEASEKIPATSVYMVERVIDETRQRNVKARKVNKAVNYIYNASKDALKIRAMLLGKYIKDAYDEEIEEYLVDIANNTPDKIIALFESNDTKYLIAFTYAKQKGILTQRGGLYYYNDADIIGRDAESCINFMKDSKNKLVTDRILKDVQEISVKNNDVITESISEENKRVETLKKDVELDVKAEENLASIISEDKFEPSNESNPNPEVRKGGRKNS